MSHHALDVWPLELWLHVAECSPAAWFRLACSLSCVGRYSLRDEDVQTRAMTRFCNSKGFLPNGARHGMYVEVDCEDYKSEVWYRSGVKHRDDDRPAVLRYYSDGTLFYEAWYRSGVKHREDDGPAVKRYYSDGTLFSEAWYRSGVKHRDDDDMPAVKRYSLDGTAVKYEEWYCNGETHRDGDLPAVKYYHSDGALAYEAWYRSGVEYRDGDLPAWIGYREDGTHIIACRACRRDVDDDGRRLKYCGVMCSSCALEQKRKQNVPYVCIAMFVCACVCFFFFLL